MIRLSDKTNGNLIALEITGKINQGDYQFLNPILDKAVKEFGKLNLLMKIQDMEGFTPKAMWEDLKEVRHLNDFNKIAIVGEKDWKKTFTKITDPLTPAEVKYFDFEEEPVAYEWVK